MKQTTFKIFRDVPRLRYPLVTTPADFLAMMDDLGDEALHAPTLIIDEGCNTLDVLVVEGGKISERHTPVVTLWACAEGLRLNSAMESGSNSVSSA